MCGSIRTAGAVVSDAAFGQRPSSIGMIGLHGRITCNLSEAVEVLRGHG